MGRPEQRSTKTLKYEVIDALQCRAQFYSQQRKRMHH